MHATKRLGQTLVASSFLMAITTFALADRDIKEAPAHCSNAHAVLKASTANDSAATWAEIKALAESEPKEWEVVDTYPPGVVGKMSFREYDNTYIRGKAYVVSCGHGGTCNAFARAYLRKRARGFTPQVHCGRLPEGFKNEQRPQ